MKAECTRATVSTFLVSLLMLLVGCDLLGGEDDRKPSDTPLGRIVFSQLDTTTADWRAKLYAINTDGSDLTLLSFPTDSTFNPDGKPTPRGYAYNPRWGPDGRLIVYEEFQGPDESHLVLMNADGSAKRDLTPVGGYAAEAGISPDGTRILYGEGGFGAIFGLFVKDADGSNRTCIVCPELLPPVTFEGEAMGFAPQVWGPTSDLVYGLGGPLEDLQTPPEVLHLYELRISTREIVRRLTKHPLPRSSQFSPDGHRAFYIVYARRDGLTLYLFPSLEAEPEVLLECPLDRCKDFRWGSDSRHIIFVRRRQGAPEGQQFNKQLYFMDVDGDRTPVRVLTPFADHDTPALYLPQE